MNEFKAGIKFAVCMAVFGKCAYEIGRIDERKRNIKQWKEVNKGLNEIIEVLEKKQKESKRNA